MYKIKSYIGFDKIQFGMTSEQISKELNEKPRRLKKTIDDTVWTDAYDNFYIYYDEHGNCEAIEFNNDAKLDFENKKLYEMFYNDLENMFKMLDPKIEIEETGFTSYLYGIGAYVSSKSKNDAFTESIIIFKKGYYD